MEQKMTYKRVSNSKAKKKARPTNQTTKRKSSHYKYWDKENKTTWVHRPSGQKVIISHKLVDELGFYNIDCWSKDRPDYINIGLSKSFDEARSFAITFMRRNDTPNLSNL